MAVHIISLWQSLFSVTKDAGIFYQDGAPYISCIQTKETDYSNKNEKECSMPKLKKVHLSPQRGS